MRIAVLLVGGRGIVMNPASGLLRLKPCDEEFPSPDSAGAIYLLGPLFDCQEYRERGSEEAIQLAKHCTAGALPVLQLIASLLPGLEMDDAPAYSAATVALSNLLDGVSSLASNLPEGSTFPDVERLSSGLQNLSGLLVAAVASLLGIVDATSAQHVTEYSFVPTAPVA